jgi:hypothetical protein
MTYLPCVQPSKYDYYASGGTIGTFGTPAFNDPVQGKYLNNCSLIAAFASLAWKGKINTQASDPRTKTYSFQFYNPNKLQKADGMTPLDSRGKLMHAKSDTENEIWPALYEKAYYMWLDKIDDPSGRPNYCNYTGWQNPVTVMKQLTGLAMSPIQTAPLVALTAFNDIDAFCTDQISNTNRAIRSPAVAWTYSTGSQYSDSTIVKEHTYSLLGVAGTKDYQNKWVSRYVVLRNPWGKVSGEPTGMPAGSLYTAVAWCKGIILGNTDGIFALRYDLFAAYFAGYSWILL